MMEERIKTMTKSADLQYVQDQLAAAASYFSDLEPTPENYRAAWEYMSATEQDLQKIIDGESLERGQGGSDEIPL